jgi:hypothetical protein
MEIKHTKEEEFSETGNGYKKSFHLKYLKGK